MRLLVDAMNVLHAWTAGPAEGKANDVAALARAIARSRYASDEVVLVVDGTPPPEAASPDGRFEASGAAIIFSGPGVEADDVIERILAAPGPVRETIVVSADRRLGRAAHRRGARSMTAATFVGVLMQDGARWSRAESLAPGDDPGKAGLLESGEVEAWLDAFGVRGGPSPERPAAPRPAAPPPGGLPADRPPEDPALPNRAKPPAPKPGAPPPAKRPGKEPDWQAELEREWPGLSDDDLDMGKWLDEPQ